MYIGFRLQKKEKYAQRYQQARQNLKPQTALPAINQTIHLVLTDGKEETGLLQSFGYDRLYVTTPETGKRRVILFAQLQAIRSEDGAAIDTETLQTLIRSHKIPVQYLLQFRVGDRIKTIYPEDIKYVRYTHTPNTGKIAGLLAGIAVDGLIVLSLQQAPAETSTQEGGSCPFVYSFDGQRYRLDSESFGGAIFRKAARSDWDRLDYLRAVNGSCYLRITNELAETQFIDQVQLLVVDHPEDCRVVPSFTGQLFTVSDRLAPITAVDLEQKDVRSYLLKRDNQFWISYPFDNVAASAEQVRDGLVLTFPPRQSQTGKLILSFKNTQWAEETELMLLGFYGSSLKAWYQLMNASSAARAKFKQAVQREAMLAVDIRRGSQWQLAGYVWFNGPHVDREQVIPLNLNGLPEDEPVTVRLSATAGLWQVDYAAMDYSPERNVAVTPLDPARAVDQSGRDIRSLIREIDDQYFEMPTNDSRADLEFMIPEKNGPGARSYILKIHGYYRMNYFREGKPQLALLRSFGKKEGAFGQYTIRLINKIINESMAKVENEPGIQD